MRRQSESLCEELALAENRDIPKCLNRQLMCPTANCGAKNVHGEVWSMAWVMGK